jgi:AraC-like DNA-binding protein
MLGDGLDAASAAFCVGYESLSQFSRECRRLFGAPPPQDLAALKAEAQPPKFAGYHTDPVPSDS